MLKQRLKIGYVEKFRDIQWQMQWRTLETVYSNKPGKPQVWSGLTYTDRDLYYDPRIGTVEEAL